MNTYKMNPSETAQHAALVADSARQDKLCRMAVQDRDFGAAERHAATAAEMLRIAHLIADGQAPAL